MPVPKIKNAQRKDAGEGAFFQRELELMKPGIYEVAYPMLKASTAMPVSSDKNPAATQISYRMFDLVGVAKLISNYADDLPRADILGKEFFLPVHTLGIACGWTIFEIAAGLETGRPIDKSRLAAAVKLIQTLADKLAWLGDSTVNLIGFTATTSMPNTVVPTYDAVVTWDAKILKGAAGKNAILDDLMLPFTRMSVATKGTESFNACALAPSSYQQIAQTRSTDTSDLTILEFFKKTHPEIEFITCPYLETSGTGSAKQMIFFTKDADKFSLEIPQDVTVHEGQFRNLEHIVPITMRYAGLQVRYPLSMDSSYGM